MLISNFLSSAELFYVILDKTCKMENNEAKTLHIFRSYKLQAAGAALHVVPYNLDIGTASLRSSGMPSLLQVMHFF
jgi:hypothetical protein